MTVDSQSRAVDKLIAALKAEGRDDEAAVVQEMRPNKDRELRAAPVAGSPPDQGQQVEPGSSSPVPSVPMSQPASLGAHIEWWDDLGQNARHYRHIECDDGAGHWVVPLDDCPPLTDDTAECAHCCYVRPLSARRRKEPS